MITGKKKRHVILCGVAVCINIAFIWGNSLLPAHISSAISTFVRDVIAMLFPGDGLQNDPSAGHGILRKIAHGLEFCALGALMCTFLHLIKKAVLFSLPLGILVGSIDECIQRFVPGRGPHIRDVFIDTLGVIAGIGVFTIVLTICKRKLQQNMEESQL